MLSLSRGLRGWLLECEITTRELWSFQTKLSLRSPLKFTAVSFYSIFMTPRRPPVAIYEVAALPRGSKSRQFLSQLPVPPHRHHLLIGRKGRIIGYIDTGCSLKGQRPSGLISYLQSQLEPVQSPQSTCVGLGWSPLRWSVTARASEES